MGLQVDTYKYLGVWLDSSLSFQTHINQLQAKIKSRIGFLFRNKASFTFPAKLAFVKMIILPIIDFGDIIHRFASNSLLRKLDVPSVLSPMLHTTLTIATFTV